MRCVGGPPGISVWGGRLTKGAACRPSPPPTGPISFTSRHYFESQPILPGEFQCFRLYHSATETEGFLPAKTLVALGTRTLTLWFAKTLADFEINDIAALPPLLCYNSYLCFDSSACASERWFVSSARVRASYSRTWRYVNNSPS